MSQPVESCPPWALEPLHLLKARSWRFGVQGALSLILLRNNADHFSIRGPHSLVPLWSNADLAVKGFLGNWARLILLVILSLSFMRSKFPLNFAFYIRHPGRTILLHLQTPKFYKNSKFSSPLMNQECCLDPGCRSWGKGSRGQRSSYLSTGQERKLSPSARNLNGCRLRQALDGPPNANQECTRVG